MRYFAGRVTTRTRRAHVKIEIRFLRIRSCRRLCTVYRYVERARISNRLVLRGSFFSPPVFRSLVTVKSLRKFHKVSLDCRDGKQMRYLMFVGIEKIHNGSPRHIRTEISAAVENSVVGDVHSSRNN